jgi:hypothetical protein
MLRELGGQLLVALIAALLSFMAGVFFADPIRRGIERWRRLTKLRKRKTTVVRVFPVLYPLPLEQLTHLLLLQNRLQTLFQLEMANWRAWPGSQAGEARLRALQTDSRLEFTERFQAEMQDYNQAFGANKEDPVNIAITGLPFPKNFYCWNTRDRHGIVIGISSLQVLFGEEPLVVDKIILRVVQRMLLYSLAINELKAHPATRGCLFDLTPLLTDLQFSVNKTFLCSECERAIGEDKGVDFLESVRFWVEGHKPKDVASA